MSAEQLPRLLAKRREVRRHLQNRRLTKEQRLYSLIILKQLNEAIKEEFE